MTQSDCRDDLAPRETAEGLGSQSEAAETTEQQARRLVSGEGPATAAMMIVGEAPGHEEELQGRPFVGLAGRLLNQLLQQAGIRREDVYITNVVKRRPVKQVGGVLTTRAPNAGEVRRELPLLLQEIARIRPVVIVCLGRVAASTLIRKNFRMGRERGKLFRTGTEIPTIATFHPAYIRRPRGMASASLREMAIEDLRAASALTSASRSPRLSGNTNDGQEVFRN